MDVAFWVALATVVIALCSLAVAGVAERRTRHAARISELLGAKETVGFGASRLLTEGFGRPGRRRRELALAVLNACLFEGADRARGILLAAVERYAGDVPELATELQRLRQAYRAVEGHELSTKELDLRNARLRLRTVKKVVDPAADIDRWWPPAPADAASEPR